MRYHNHVELSLLLALLTLVDFLRTHTVSTLAPTSHCPPLAPFAYLNLTLAADRHYLTQHAHSLPNALAKLKAADNGLGWSGLAKGVCACLFQAG